jgi:aldehyde:ferredoxin oxidoreductase
MGATAWINLTTAEIRREETDAALLRQFLGGRGLAARLLFDLVGPEVDPLAPENYLIFTAAPFAGSPWPTSARLHVTFKSPLTGCYGYANTGGQIVAQLRHAGYDALLVTGRAAQPSIVRVLDDEITIAPAPDLWGLRTGAVFDALTGAAESKRGRGCVACIGPAGENLARIAAIINDRGRAAARGGPGAVMGSKNLKALHVTATKRPEVHPEFRAAAKGATSKVQRDPHLDGLRRWGTLVLMDGKNIGGDQPAKNHQLAQVPFISRINAHAFDPYIKKHRGCYGCPIKCSRDSSVDDGPFRVELEGPEYETTNALGPMCWLGDPEAILYGNHLCNEYGLDTISTGVTIAFALELRQRGLIGDEPDLPLAWGNPQSVHGLIERIALRRGLGDVLAEGTRRAAERIANGAERYAMQVKGMELPRQEPRFSKGFALGHATANRGADHLYGLPAIDLAGAWAVARRLFPAEIVPELMDPDNETYKADMLVFGEHFCAVTDSLGICKFSTIEEYALFPEDLAPGVEALWGRPITGQELLEIGERVVNLERMYNVRQGMSRADDLLPARFTTEPVPLYDFTAEEPADESAALPDPVRHGIVRDFDAMLNRYYALRGWSADGAPTDETLARLNLHDLIASR